MKLKSQSQNNGRHCGHSNVRECEEESGPPSTRRAVRLKRLIHPLGGYPQFGERLVAAGTVTPQQLEEALTAQRVSGGLLGETIGLRATMLFGAVEHVPPAPLLATTFVESGCCPLLV